MTNPAADYHNRTSGFVKYIIPSDFTLCVVSPRYFESGNCEEEAVICKVLDMAERKRRLVPLVLDAVKMPVWMYDIVGIDFTDKDPLVPPFEKLVKTLGKP